MSSSRAVTRPSYSELIAERRRDLARLCAEILPSPGRHVLEVGSGHGHFLTAYAARHPDRVCVGIDLLGERVDRAVRKLKRAQLGNLHFLHAEVSLYLECLPPQAELRDVFMLFPDPWPKVRHHKHRLINPTVLGRLGNRAAIDCRLYFRTDFFPYYEASVVVFGQSQEWEVVPEPWPFEFETVFQSRAQAHYSLVAKRRA